MTQKLFALIVVLVIGGFVIIWAGYGNTDDILYQRLDGIGMSEDSINMVMALPRGVMLDWDKGNGRTYLVVDEAVAAAAIITVDTLLFNYNHLRRGKK